VQTIDQLEQACANTHRLVAGVTTDQWTLGTPCEKWDVRELVNHVTWTLQMCGAAIRKEAPPARDIELVGTDPTTAFGQSAADALAAWRSLDSLDGTIELPIGEVPAIAALGINLVDVHVHGWDIARATGQDPALDPALSATALEVSEQLLPAVGRGAAFAEQVPIAGGAPVSDRVMAYLGRQP
jgi:uncharacterized protein (TIGR03086 family)